MAARIFAVLAAVFLVVAVGVASLAPLDLTLGQGLLIGSPGPFEWVRAHSAGWLWNWLEVPFLLRPLWFLPVALSVISGGAAMSCSFGKAASTRRRRS